MSEFGPLLTCCLVRLMSAADEGEADIITAQRTATAMAKASSAPASARREGVRRISAEAVRKAAQRVSAAGPDHRAGHASAQADSRRDQEAVRSAPSVIVTAFDTSKRT